MTGPPPPVPAWLSEFTLADWYDVDEVVPLAEQADLGETPWRCLRAWLRWQQAGRDWLAESGRDGSYRGWRDAVGPWGWSADPHRLAKQVSGGA